MLRDMMLRYAERHAADVFAMLALRYVFRRQLIAAAVTPCFDIAFHRRYAYAIISLLAACADAATPRAVDIFAILIHAADAFHYFFRRHMLLPLSLCCCRHAIRHMPPPHAATMLRLITPPLCRHYFRARRHYAAIAIFAITHAAHAIYFFSRHVCAAFAIAAVTLPLDIRCRELPPLMLMMRAATLATPAPIMLLMPHAAALRYVPLLPLFADAAAVTLPCCFSPLLLRGATTAYYTPLPYADAAAIMLRHYITLLLVTPCLSFSLVYAAMPLRRFFAL